MDIEIDKLSYVNLSKLLRLQTAVLNDLRARTDDPLASRYIFPYSDDEILNLNDKQRFIHVGGFSPEDKEMIASMHFKKQRDDMPEVTRDFFPNTKMCFASHALVHPKYRGLGLATKGLLCGIKAMHDEEFDIMTIGLLHTNKSAKSVVKEHAGFKKFDEREILNDGEKIMYDFYYREL